MPDENRIIPRNFADIFSGEMRYIIPFFQRGYVWGSRQWNQLKWDIEEQILDAATNGDFAVQEHFFGPIVVAEKPNQHPRVKVFDIIDGQQRMTTVYLMLAYFRRRLATLIMQAPQAERHSAEIGKWLENTFVNPPDDDYWRIKLFSVKGDRVATYYAVFDKQQNPRTPDFQSDLQLYLPDVSNIAYKFERWMARNFGESGDEEIWRWVRALTECLKVVWIPLGERDDPQAIFESLNDKGIQLTAPELLCNYLFRPLIDDRRHTHEELHRGKWLGAQSLFDIPGLGSDFEEYLRHFFSIGENKAVGKGRRLYVSFKQRNKNLDAAAARKHLDDIRAAAAAYRGRILGVPLSALGNKKRTRADELLRLIKSTNMASCRPFLLAILRAEEGETMSGDDAERLLREVYVLLVRRKVAELPVNRYDTFFPSLLDKITANGGKVAAFHKAVAEMQLWVSDEEFRDAFVKHPIYRPRELNFTNLVIREIDKSWAKARAYGELPDYSTLNTVEHIAPQTLDVEGAWKHELGEDAESEQYQAIIHTIGNLCLRSREANAGMGNSPFAKKKEKLRDSQSPMARAIAERPGPWNFAAIKQRSEELADEALKIWAWDKA